VDMTHEFTRSVVIRLRYRVGSDGSSWNAIWVDSDLPDRDTTLGVLLRAQGVVFASADEQHDAIDLSPLDEQLGVTVIDVDE
jgi:hypothetical protein